MTLWIGIRTFMVWFLSLAVALVSLRFLPWGVEATMEFVAYHAVERHLAFYAHVTLGPLALALIPFQFTTRLRTNRPALHRWMGHAYAVAILLAGVGGLVMAWNTTAGPVAAWGFGLLAVLWLATTALAVRFAMRRQITLHRRWMLRSAALTWAAVTLRVQLPILGATLGFEIGYPLVAWSCWVPNVLFAEWLLRRRARKAAHPA